MTRLAVAAIVLAASSPAALPTAADAPPLTLAVVLDRADAYVGEFHRQLAGVVAEEHYVQNAQMPAVRPLKLPTLEHRELNSDLLLVNVAGTTTWLEFRDVFEVDGQPVRNRSDRLTRLFLSPSPTANDQIRAI